MKLLRWKRFTWEVSKLPPLENSLPSRYTLRPAQRDEMETVSGVIMRALSLDPAWSDSLKLFRDRLATQIAASFERENVPALVIAHGPRIIAASTFETDAEAENHLDSGPCVLTEYHSRGLGTALLHATLQQLRHDGLDHVHGVTRHNVVASKFVYRKFGAVSADFEPTLALAHA